MVTLEKVKEQLEKIKNNPGDSELVSRTIETIVNELEPVEIYLGTSSNDLESSALEIKELKETIAAKNDNIFELENKVSELEKQIIVGPNMKEEAEKLDLIEIKGMLDTIVRQQSALSVNYEGLKDIARKQAENTKQSIKVLKDNVTLITKVSTDNTKIKQKFTEIEESQTLLENKIEEAVEEVSEKAEETLKTSRDLVDSNLEDMRQTTETVILEGNKIKEALVESNKKEMESHNDTIEEIFKKQEERVKEFCDSTKDEVAGLRDEHKEINGVFSKIKDMFK